MDRVQETLHEDTLITFHHQPFLTVMPDVPTKQSPRLRAEDTRGSSTLVLALPGSKWATPRPKRHRLKPHLKRNASIANKLVFSVDDDIGDVEPDHSGDEAPPVEFLEGYNAALKALYQKRKSLSGGPLGFFDDDFRRLLRHNAEEYPPKTALETSILSNLHSAEESLRMLESDDIAEGNENEEPGNANETAETGLVRSTSSSETIESLNLRERQDAINSTHPFGIKIWKPSLYKKNRLVAARAQEDIHAFDPRKPAASIHWGVHVTNFMWLVTFGLFLFLVCSGSAIVVFLLSGFAIHRQLRPYVKLLFSLGRYWLSPFGKFVLLNKDKNYWDEDELDGRLLLEFHRWRSQEEGRLFFAPPRRLTTSDESRPLLKDHRGRPVRDAYSSLGEHGSGDEFEAVEDSQDGDGDGNDIKVRFFGRGSWSLGRLAFYVLFYGLLQPIFYLVGLLGWLAVFTIPMSNVLSVLCDHLRRHPLALHFELEKLFYVKLDNELLSRKLKNQSIVLCTYRSCAFHYYKYTIDGTNIFFINLLAAVVFVIFDYYVLKETLHWDTWYTDALFLFGACLFSIIPLAYFIGQAVASILAQSSMGVGAVINAFFSTVVEIFLYCVALNQGKGKLVEGSMIGSILGGVLLLPGLSMCGGALKRKTQRYNPRLAGVSSTMLLYAMVIMFAPSLFYQMYGLYEIKCRNCDFLHEDDCTQCRFSQPTFALDKLYYNMIRPFSLIVTLALFLAYICGLFFTLRTHALLIWATNSHEQQAHNLKKDLRSSSVVSLDTPQQLPRQGRTPQAYTLPPSAGFVPTTGAKSALNSPGMEVPKNRIASRGSRLLLPGGAEPVPSMPEEEPESAGGHDAPNWSRNKSTVILLGATLLYAVIAEILVDNVDLVLSAYPINPKFLGLTVFALVPNTTEFLNAISFAVGGNVALSMEIGSAYALQVVLIQIPSLVVYTVFKGFTNPDSMFTLVFPRWDIIATLVSIYLFTYIYAEGKSNYFKGVILILIYVVVLIGFWLNDLIEDLEDGYNYGGAALVQMLQDLMGK